MCVCVCACVWVCVPVCGCVGVWVCTLGNGLKNAPKPPKPLSGEKTNEVNLLWNQHAYISCNT